MIGCQLIALEWFTPIGALVSLGFVWRCVVARGDKFFVGWEINKWYSALYVDGEMAQIDLKQRFQDLVGEIPLTNLFILPSEELYREGYPLCLMK